MDTTRGVATAARPWSTRPTWAEVHTALRRSLVLFGLSLRALALGLWLSVVYTFLPTGLSVPLLPGSQRAVRRLVDRQRKLAAQWSGVSVPARYPPLPDSGQGPELHALLARRHNQVWRDWRFVVIDPLAGGVIAFVPTALLLSSVWGLVTAFFGGQLSHAWGNIWYMFIPVSGPFTAVLAGLLAVAVALVALWDAPHTAPRHARYLLRVLAPSADEAMAERIEHLTTTRSDAVDTQMAEIRRIERDLHDGAQARLVAMGMTLGAAERLLKSDPDKVPALLAEARASSSKALDELRDLVRGIHPPVLADRGLGDAIRSLAHLCPLSTEVTIDLPGRPEPPVESAAYFAVSEILTNAAKHSGAARAWIDVRYVGGMLRIDVTDDGRGGADPSRGTGLQGVERRLATFDGVLAVSSPPAGPTLITMELPCALSSPKTTSS
ncbi:sensor histidine kinase [Streptacidiphilus melanogenes]|uniref:sensor histidine kinase n=1 Tax=Streptacidiphilus melanogenes TaxID=411235 RepID=UPI001269E7B0|nr:sensor histidine kinase [Streptacidiphilus melanogenes]